MTIQEAAALLRARMEHWELSRNVDLGPFHEIPIVVGQAGRRLYIAELGSNQECLGPRTSPDETGKEQVQGSLRTEGLIRVFLFVC